jgi:hypothetical protein
MRPQDRNKTRSSTFAFSSPCSVQPLKVARRSAIACLLQHERRSNLGHSRVVCSPPKLEQKCIRWEAFYRLRLEEHVCGISDGSIRARSPEEGLSFSCRRVIRSLNPVPQGISNASYDICYYACDRFQTTSKMLQDSLMCIAKSVSPSRQAEVWLGAATWPFGCRRMRLSV